jgi:hypothetical protein
MPRTRHNARLHSRPTRRRARAMLQPSHAMGGRLT